MSELEVWLEQEDGDCFEAEIDKHAEGLKLVVVFVGLGF